MDGMNDSYLSYHIQPLLQEQCVLVRFVFIEFSKFSIPHILVCSHVLDPK